MTETSFTFETLEHFATAQMVFGAWKAGFWEPFESDLDHRLDVEAFATKRGLVTKYVGGVARYLARRGFLAQTDDGRFELAEKGRELVGKHWLPYYVFLVGGYGGVLAEAGELMRGGTIYGKDLHRDGHFVALGSELQGKSPYHKSYETILSRAVAGPAELVVDLGCGSAAFLIALAKRTGAKSAIGIDVSGPACELARERVAEAGLADTVRIFEGDARDLMSQDPELEGTVDVVTAMFLVHELLSEGTDRTSERLRELSRVLRPGTGRLLIMDKHTDVLEAGETPPYFTEFQLVHDLTDQVLCNRETWHRVLKDAGLEISHEKRLGAHTGTIFFECRRL